jgi:hypothetical protein
MALALAEEKAILATKFSARNAILARRIKEIDGRNNGAQSFSPWSEPVRHNIPRAYAVRPLGMRSQPMESRTEPGQENFGSNATYWSEKGRQPSSEKVTRPPHTEGRRRGEEVCEDYEEKKK